MLAFITSVFNRKQYIPTRHHLHWLVPIIILTSCLGSACDRGGSRQGSEAGIDAGLPDGWHRSGDKAHRYVMGVEHSNAVSGSKVATIKSKDDLINGFGTLMQNIQPDQFLGKRIRMTGHLRTEDASSARFWLRVDRAGRSEPLAFDNMDDRPVTGTTDWREYSIVLDVPEVTTNIAFGAMLIGSGSIWFDNIRFDTVDTTVKTTGAVNFGQLLKFNKPVNLDFEN